MMPVFVKVAQNQIKGSQFGFLAHQYEVIAVVAADAEDVLSAFLHLQPRLVAGRERILGVADALDRLGQPAKIMGCHVHQCSQTQ